MKHEKHPSPGEEKKAIQCELHGIPVRLPSAAKYKKDRWDKKSGPDLEVGKVAVLSYDKGSERVGYYKAVLVDWDDEAGWWNNRTDLFFVVLENSNDKVPDRVGRIVVANWPGSWGNSVRVLSWNESDFKKILA